MGGSKARELKDKKRNRRLNVGTDGEMGDRRGEDIKKRIMDSEKDERQKQWEVGGVGGSKHDVIRMKSGS